MVNAKGRTAPGEVQHSRDDQIRTIRVDNFWRCVVLAPQSGDRYYLIRVLPHDKANAYATSHWSSVNQAFSVLEARDEEAIQQLRPSLQTVARPHTRRLFADVSDADPTRLGVDAQTLPQVPADQRRAPRSTADRTAQRAVRGTLRGGPLPSVHCSCRPPASATTL